VILWVLCMCGMIVGGAGGGVEGGGWCLVCVLRGWACSCVWGLRVGEEEEGGDG